ncbi:MAG: type II toxin-antitoxin system HicB family antitoxin [bacterium]
METVAREAEKPQAEVMTLAIMSGLQNLRREHMYLSENCALILVSNRKRGVCFMRYFTLEYWQDDGWYVGRLKEVPGVFSQGVSLQELEENIRDAYQVMMEEQNEVVPRAAVQTKELGVEL